LGTICPGGFCPFSEKNTFTAGDRAGKSAYDGAVRALQNLVPRTFVERDRERERERERLTNRQTDTESRERRALPSLSGNLQVFSSGAVRRDISVLRAEWSVPGLFYHHHHCYTKGSVPDRFQKVPNVERLFRRGKMLLANVNATADSASLCGLIYTRNLS